MTTISSVFWTINIKIPINIRIFLSTKNTNFRKRNAREILSTSREVLNRWSEAGRILSLECNSGSGGAIPVPFDTAFQ